MNLIEILKAKGISDDLIQAIQEDMKANSIFTASEENLDIRYGKLKTQSESDKQQLTEANKLIEDLQKSNKGNEALQKQVTDYQQQMAQLQKELEETKVDAEAKVALLAAKAVDVDYLLYKMRENARKEGKEITLDDNGKIKGWDTMLESLQTQSPNMFEAASSDDGYQVLNPNKLKNGDKHETTTTKEQFMAMGYEERMALKQKNEKLYNEMVK